MNFEKIFSKANEKGMSVALISPNKNSQAFDYAFGKTEKAALAAVKRKNSHDWRDCCIWIAETRPIEMD